MRMSDPALRNGCRRLLGMYDVRGWWPARSRFEIMVGAVLVQNTRWDNVSAAIRNLRRHGCMNAAGIATRPAPELAALIRPAGCQSVKVRRLQALAEWVTLGGGLRKLAALDTDVLRRGLLAVHGVGPETADAILCFAFGRRRFVADAYARRWLERMGFPVRAPISAYEDCRSYVEAGLSRSRIHFGDLHAAIVLHGQETCAVEPCCSRCRLQRDCAYGAGRGNALLRVEALARNAPAVGSE